MLLFGTPETRKGKKRALILNSDHRYVERGKAARATKLNYQCVEAAAELRPPHTSKNRMVALELSYRNQDSESGTKRARAYC